jgi:ureidoglycolate lyase
LAPAARRDSFAAMSRTLTIQPLTAAAFAPFGDVIEGLAGLGRADDLANVSVGADGRTQMSVLKAERSNALPLTVKRVERHPLGSQAFIPMGGGAFFVVVAPPGEFDPSKLVAFRTNGVQGINYKPGTWHHSFVAKNEGDAFLIVERFGPGANCDFAHLEQPITVVG